LLTKNFGRLGAAHLLAGLLTLWSGSLQAAPTRAQAVFAGGCFWCIEADLDRIPGVIATVSGYAGGARAHATYAQVSAGGTGHLEAVRVTYDPARISFEALLSRFFRTIDPTDPGGQFCDRGDQYRSAVFVANAAERRAALAEVARAQARLRRPVHTRVLPVSSFYSAEASHQDYHRRNPVRYRFYRLTCGRDRRLAQLWGR
jgi:peptide-methionine (S)-S-oxide reductase